MVSAGAVALFPTIVKAVAAIGTILSSFFGGLLLGIAFDNDDTESLKERIESMLLSNPKPEAKTVALVFCPRFANKFLLMLSSDEKTLT
ncbi:hypothetical protein QR680_016677 [Steinernema hermaphroditum]|uniref:Uncharacterized protein n=1 Tax=Steinernema hermaphroditum TaxID=289476 RepID=A0AA39HBZ5_9BILA|nr:hypothetical protein QR680_016677 [Steinernema hermaphroditum]